MTQESSSRAAALVPNNRAGQGPREQQKGSAPPEESESRDPLRHWLVLVRLCDLRLRELPGFRFARFAGPAIALGWGSAMLILLVAGTRNVLDVLVVRALTWLSWLVAGSAALSAARNLAARDVTDGIVDLVAQRGHDVAELPAARSFATAFRIAVLTGVPALSLSILALGASSSWAIFGARCLLFVEVIGYASLLGIVLALLARVSASLVETRGPALFAAILLVPHIVHQFNPSVPSIIGLFDGLLDHLVELGQ